MVVNSFLQSSLCLTHVILALTIVTTDVVYHPRFIQLICFVFGGDKLTADGIAGLAVDGNTALSDFPGERFSDASDIRHINMSKLGGVALGRGVGSGFLTPSLVPGSLRIS